MASMERAGRKRGHANPCDVAVENGVERACRLCGFARIRSVVVAL